MKILLTLCVLVTLAASMASTCGGNCPVGCPNCFCGNNKRMEDIATWCAKHNWEQNCCKCIVSHESLGNANFMHHNSTDGSYGVGLWQINNINWGECNNGHAPCDPSQNLHCAIMVYTDAGNSWKVWGSHSACGCWSLNINQLYLQNHSISMSLQGW